MAGKSAVLTIKILSDASKASAGMDDAASKTSKFQKGLSSGAKVGAVALVGLAAAGTKATLAAEEVASANARVTQTLSNAGMDKATDRVLDYAKSLEGSLGIDEKVIKNTQAKLATFHSLAASAGEAGGAFDRATLAAQDMAAAGFGDAESNAVQLGKALEDPVKGITALNKSGVNFTEQQKKQIKAMTDAGDVAGAQDVILSNLEAQVGGTAAATADSSAKMSLAFADVGETIGAILLPVLNQMAPILQSVAGWMSENARVVVVIGGVIAALATGIIVLNAAFKVYQATQVAFGAITKVLAAGQAVLNAVMAANPIAIVILAVVALIAGITLLWKKNEGFRNFVIGAWEAIAGAATAAWNGIKAAAAVVFSWLKAIARAVFGVLRVYFLVYKTVAIAVFRAIKAVATTAWNGIKAVVSAVVNAIRTYINAIRTVATAVFRAIRTIAATAFNGIKATVSNVMSAIRTVLNGLKTFATGIWNGIRNAAATAFNALKRAATTAMNAIKRPIDGVKAAFDAVKNAIENVINWIKRIKFPSPPKWFSKITGGGKSATMSAPAGPAVAPGVGLRGTAPILAGAGGTFGGGGITINVNGTLNDVAAARAVRRVIRNDDRRRGGVILGGSGTRALVGR